MPGSFDAVPDAVALARPAPIVAVFRYTPGAASADQKYEFLPNIRCLSVSRREMAEPGSARFRYVFGDPLLQDGSYPTRAHQVFGYGSSGTGVVMTDDQLVVRVYFPNLGKGTGTGGYQIAFDGFVQHPQLDMSGGMEAVTFEAMGTPVRCWDAVITGAARRDASDPDAGVVTELFGTKVRFNPEGLPNATPATFDVDEGTATEHPVFLDENLKGRTPDPRRAWTLGMACRYLLFHYNKAEAYVRNPDATMVDAVLESWEPVDGETGALDPNDSSTYTTDTIDVSDLDVTGEAWPVALQKLLEPHGFAFAFRLEYDENGDPDWHIDIYRTDVDEPLKDVFLQAIGEPLDPRLTNVGHVAVQRDGDVANAWVALTAPTRYEFSAVLAPANAVDPADNALASIPGFDVLGVDFDPVKYRTWVLDEDGTGHAATSGSGWATTLTTGTPTDLSNLFGKTADDPQGPKYVPCRRPPKSSRLISTDSQGEPLQACVHISTDYSGPVPGEWDGTGTWQAVAPSAWDLLKDRFGIRVVAKDVNDWNIGAPPVGGATAPPIAHQAFSAGRVRLVDCTSNPMSGGDTQTPRVFIRLTAVIESDVGVGADPFAVAERRDASPTSFEVLRADEVRDRFRNDIRMKSSYYPDKDTRDASKKAQELIRYDLAKVKAHTMARRRAHEFPKLSGSVVVPRLTFAYEVGDRVREVSGRGIEFTQNLRADPREGPVYPYVPAIDMSMDETQATTLHLTYRRPDPVMRKKRGIRQVWGR